MAGESGATSGVLPADGTAVASALRTLESVVRLQRAKD
jgi:hypothetical protein